MSGIATTAHTYEEMSSISSSTQHRTMSPADENQAGFPALKPSPHANNHSAHVVHTHPNSGFYHHSEPTHPRRNIPQLAHPSSFHHHHHHHQHPLYNSPKFHYQQQSQQQQQVHQHHLTNSQVNSQLPLTQHHSRVESNSTTVVSSPQNQEHQLQHSRKLSAFTHHHIDQTTTDSCSSTQPAGNNESKSYPTMQEHQGGNPTTISESCAIKSEEINSVVQKPQLLFSATKDPSATSFSASSNPSSPFPVPSSSSSVGPTAMKNTLGFHQQPNNNASTTAASPSSPSPTTSSSIYQQQSGGRLPLVSNLPSANVAGHQHQQLPSSPRDSSRIEATFGLSSPVRHSNSFFETSPALSSTNNVVRTNAPFAREGGSFKPFVASPTSTSSSPSTSSGISSLIPSSSSSSSAFSTPQPKYPPNTNSFSSPFAPPTKPQSFYPNGATRTNTHQNTSPYENRSHISVITNPNNYEKSRVSYPPSPSQKTKSNTTAPATVTYSIEEARNSGSDEDVVGSPTKPESETGASEQKIVNAADRVWAYEVKKQDISLDIEVKSKKETFTNYIPVELYCTYIYKVCVKVSGIKKTNKPYVLVAFLQILNGNTLEEVLKEGARIMEGSANSQIQNSDYFILRVKFTETSYHLNRLQFYMRISIYQVFGEDIADLANLTPEFVLTHNSYNNGNNLLASTLSPLFFIYSKKNHTKKAQKQARILSQQRQLEQQRKRQQSSQGSRGGRSKRRKTNSAQTPEDEEDIGMRTRSGNRFRKSPNKNDDDFEEEDYNEEADSSPSPEDD